MTMIQHLRGAALPFLAGILAATPLAAQYPAEPGDGIADLAGVLTPADAESIRGALHGLRTDAGVEVAVLTVRNVAAYGAASGEAFATGVYNHWRLGYGQRQDGVLVLLSVDDRFTRIELGDGVPAEQDARMRAVVDDVMVPRFRQGEMSGGVREGVLAVAAAFSASATESAALPGPVPLAETVPTRYDNPDDDVALSGGALLLILLAGAAAAAAGAYLYQRSVKNRCARCGETMARLDGRAAAAHLDGGQQLEEELGSVSHAVWRCTGCGAHEVRHDPRLSEWDRCEECGYRTVRTTTSVVREPTPEYDGGEQATATCACCGWSRVEVVRHPARRPVRVPEDRDRWREDEPAWTHNDDSASSGGGGGGSSSGRGASGRW